MTYRYKILSIDGGGIRGIIPALILAELEKCSGKSIAESFDLIAGTSTGGVLAMGLTKPHSRTPQRPQYSAADLVDLYCTQGKRIFQERFPGRVDEWLSNPKHSSKGKEAVFSEYLGETTLDQALTDIFVTSYDTQLRKPIFFTGNPNAEEHDNSLNFRRICSGFTMKQAAMATSAAPTFFEPYRMPTSHRDTPRGFYSLIDGAVYANNPTLLAALEARMDYRRRQEAAGVQAIEELYLPQILIVSLGTGALAHSYAYETVQKWGKLEWIQPFIHITFDGQSESVDSQLSSFLRAACTEQHYYRFQIDLDETHNAMDDTSEINIRRLKDLAYRMIEEQASALERLCQALDTNPRLAHRSEYIAV
ncbi:MAG: patatin-like phospholipase family protein [Synechococcales cyanobacterium C42_A2020_086]|jgi:patatin-like phospholipase/acyl hydrolase|nr:patatin-like phospholipase family protein [Synechococcales cyanobacterium C42_A2020_086]